MAEGSGERGPGAVRDAGEGGRHQWLLERVNAAAVHSQQPIRLRRPRHQLIQACPVMSCYLTFLSLLYLPSLLVVVEEKV